MNQCIVRTSPSDAQWNWLQCSASSGSKLALPRCALLLLGLAVLKVIRFSSMAFLGSHMGEAPVLPDRERSADDVHFSDD